MAIITCPECGEAISNKANHCVHCGCKIVVCPECEKTYIEDVEVCTECGYVLKKKNSKTKKENISETEYKDLNEVMNQWKVQGGTKLFYKPAVGFVFLVTIVVMIIAAVGSILLWEDLTEYQNTLSRVRFLYILAGVFYVLLSIHNNLGNIALTHDFSLWADSKKIDLKKLSQKTLDKDFTKMTAEEVMICASGLESAVQAAIYSNDLLIVSRRRTQSLLRVFLSTIVVVLMAIFLISNSQIYMRAELFSSDLLDVGGFEFSMIEGWWLVIVSAIALIVNIIYGSINEKQWKRTCNEWVKNNMSEFFEKYDRYVNHSVDYLADSMNKAGK